MKGILLAGGSGSRLAPVTKGVSKQLIPIYDKPMIYYSISTLMLADIREILVISTPHDLPSYERLLGNGNQFGCEISYAVQEAPRGLAEAFLIGETFIDVESVALMLGDNLFHGGGFSRILMNAAMNETGGHVFGVRVADASRYGVVEISGNGQVLSIEEKPEHPKSNIAIVGLYFFDNHVVEIAKNIKPSARGELEITEVIQAYVDDGALRLDILPRGLTWLDTGTHETVMQASQYVYAVEERSGVKIGCLEEIAMNKGWISKSDVRSAANCMANCGYSNYLKQISHEDF
jgi:glucose-1-phosphate thymidylyltransferase